MCTGTLVRYEQTVRERVARLGRRRWRVCTRRVHYEYEQIVRERVARPGRRMQRLCTGRVHYDYEKTVRLSELPWERVIDPASAH